MGKKDLKVTDTGKAIVEEYYDTKLGMWVVKSTPKPKNS